MRRLARLELIGMLALLLGFPGIGLAAPLGAQGSHSRHATPAEEAEEHLHEARHGGYFGDADDLYHYEVLLTDTHRLILYVNDERNQPLDVRMLQGRWTLNPDEASPATGSFLPSVGGAYFFASLPHADAPVVHVEVAVLKGAQWAPMEFYLPAPPPKELGVGPVPQSGAARQTGLPSSHPQASGTDLSSDTLASVRH